MRDHLLARLEPVQPAQIVGNEVDGVRLGLGQGLFALGDGHGDGGGFGVGRAVVAHRCLGVHQAVAGDVAAPCDAVVVEVMRTGDLDRARAEIGVGVVVGDDGDQAAVFFWPDRDFAKLPDDGRVAFVRGVDRNRAVAQHGFGPGGSDGDVIAGLAQRDVAVLVLLDIFVGGASRERVLEVPHVAVHLDILDFEVGNRGFEMRVPVDQPLAAVDQALVVHIDKDLDDGVVEIGRAAVRVGVARSAAHGEGLARPVAGGAEAFELTDDRAARFDLLLPDALEEFIAAHFATGGFAVCGHLALGDHLRGDARVIRTRLPERVEAAHAVPADQDVLQCVVEGVAHVQRACHVGRRDHDGKGLGTFPGVGTGLEGTALFPGSVEPVFGFLSVECLVERHGSRVLWFLGAMVYRRKERRERWLSPNLPSGGPRRAGEARKAPANWGERVLPGGAGRSHDPELML